MSLVGISPADLTVAVTRLLSSPGELQHPVRLVYLRRKPGRGLVAVYHSTGGERGIFTASLGEAALADSTHREPTVQTFPADERLPGLADAMAPTQSSAVRRALEAAAASRLPAAGRWRLLAATADPLRYKPGDRCVIRYRASFESSGLQPARASLSVIGKLYRRRSEATVAQSTLERLAAMPWSAAPLAAAESLPLLLTVDLGSGSDEPPVVPGTCAIRNVAGQTPDPALHTAATALADLHTSGVATAGTPLRTGADEAAKAGKRASALSAYLPQLRAHIQRATGRVQARLCGLTSDLSWPAHGSYKPSQLLVRGASVFLVDFDQFCLADPALDLGYFLAYLRPPGLWQRRAGTRAWFAAAAAAFLSAYDDGLRERGIDAAARSGILTRCPGYEAAALLKIAARRGNRLQSPRPREVAAILREIDQCLTATQG